MLQKDWELLQMIYVRMSEFDGVAGVTASRNTQASLKEQIQGKIVVFRKSVEWYTLYAP